MCVLELHQPAGQGQNAFLAIPVEEGDPIVVRLNPSWVVLLRVLVDEYLADGNRPTAARGWRTSEFIGKEIGKRVGHEGIEEDSTRSYVYRLRKSITQACHASGLSAIPQVIETRRGSGMRLGIELLFVD